MLKQSEFKLEKDIQTFVEQHIPDILGEEYEFVCTEFTVGDFRIDTLAFNTETKSFIIIEDKKVENKSLVDQGLTYLKLLRDRKADFILKYNEIKHTNYNINDIDISQSKVVFFSPYYNKYQIYSSDYQNIPFDLYKITKYEDDIIDVEKVERTSKEKFNNDIFKELNSDIKSIKDEIKVYTEDDHLNRFNNESINEVYEYLKDKVLSCGDVDIDVKKIYIAFKGRRNITDVKFLKNSLEVSINVKLGSIIDPSNILKKYYYDDGKPIGHNGNGDYYYMVTKKEDVDLIVPFIKQSYNINKK
jgi:predicted transport protein